jgi:hypothetical protein
MGSEVVTAMATTPVPSPHAVDAVVSADIPSRTLTVRISDLASGYQKLQWKEAWRALKRAEEHGWRNSPQTLWADTAASRRVAFATLGDDVWGGVLKFTFPSGVEAFQQLIGKPGLTATVWLDRSTHRFPKSQLQKPSKLGL